MTDVRMEHDYATERHPMTPPAAHYSTADIAAVKGCSPHAVSRMLYAARVEEDRTGLRPVWAPPLPEPRAGTRGPLRWRADREDVRVWLADPDARVWK